MHSERFTYSAGGLAGCSETSVNIHKNAHRRISQYNNICFLDFSGVFNNLDPNLTAI